MDTKLRDQVAAGTLNVDFGHCVITQRGVDDPIIYQGPGTLSQAPDKSLRLTVHAAAVDTMEAMRREFADTAEVGELTPEREYYDLRATDHEDKTWTADRVALEERKFGLTGTVIRPKLRRITRQEPDALGEVAEAFIPGDFEFLPWVRSGGAMKGGDDRITWEVSPEEQGLRLLVLGILDDVQTAHVGVLKGLAVLTGQRADPSIRHVRSQGKQSITIHSVLPATAQERIVPPITPKHGHDQASNRFLSQFVKNAHDEEPGDRIFPLWHRVRRVGQNDLTNSTLVLSVAIEALCKSVFSGQAPLDTDWVAQVEEAKKKLSAAAFPKRVNERFQNSLGSALTPTVKSMLYGLRDKHLIGADQVKAWDKLRNDAAHGGSLPTDDAGFQAHLANYFACLGLFYRLTFLGIGYQGTFVDYGSPGWPEGDLKVSLIKAAEHEV